MTDGPVVDERIVLDARSCRSDERILLTELAQYLHQTTRSVRAWGKKQRLLKSFRMRVHGMTRDVAYFTPYGAMRVIAHFRALQGEEYLKGKDWHAQRDKILASARSFMKRQRERALCR